MTEGARTSNGNRAFFLAAPGSGITDLRHGCLSFDILAPMPLAGPSPYRPPWGFSNRHVLTIWPTLVRPRPRPALRRSEFTTDDGDFLELDWWMTATGSNRLAVLCHGLEGSSRAVYMLGMGRALVEAGWDVLLMNFRGCGGRPNRLWRSYHSGETGDLLQVLRHCAADGRWNCLLPLGFSLGGSVVLNLMARHDHELPGSVTGAVAISVPCDLAGCARQMERRENWLYMQRFVRRIQRKLREKTTRLDTGLDEATISRMRTFADIDGHYTAPAHGFESAEDYWSRASCLPDLEQIRRSTLLISALDDPFLTPECYPRKSAASSDCFWLDTPPAGGHLGFVGRWQGTHYWHEIRACEFAHSLIETGSGPAGNR